MEKIYKIQTSGYGGEFCIGKIEDEKTWVALVGLQEASELSIWNTKDADGEDLEDEINFFDHDSELHISGSNYESTYFEIEEVDEDEESIDSIEVDDEWRPENFIKFRPSLVDKDVSNEEFYGYYGGFTTDKGGFETFQITIKEDLNLDKIYALTVDMDDVLSGDEIITDLLYMTYEDFKHIYETFPNDFSNNHGEDEFTFYKSNFSELVSLMYEQDKNLNLLDSYKFDTCGDSDATGRSSEAMLFNKEGYVI